MDRFPVRATNRRVDDAQKELARAAMDLEDGVARFAAEIIHGGPFSGRALNLARDAAALAQKAGAYDMARDLADINKPNGEPS